MSSIPRLSENFLEGIADDIRFAIPVFIAQQIVRYHNLDKEHISQVQADVLQLLYDHKSRLLDANYLKQDYEILEPWYAVLNLNLVDPVDLWGFLRECKYTPVIDYLKSHEEQVVLASLIFLAAEKELLIGPLGNADLESAHLLMAHKSVAELYLITAHLSGARSILDAERELFNSKLEEVRAKEKSNFASKGGHKKNEPQKALKQKAIELYNSGNYKNPRQGAKAIADDVQKYGRNVLKYYLTRDQPWEKIYQWLLEAKSLGNLRE